MDKVHWIFVALLMLTSTVLNAQDATEIVRRADLQLRGESSETEMTMLIERPTWSRSVSMKAWSKGTDYSLILITAPARDRGTTFLKRNKEIWNWVPSIGRSVKLPPSMMMQSWMGSDFTNDDLVRESSSVTDYNHTFVRMDTMDEYQVYIIDMIPKPDAAVIWGRVRTYIEKDHYLQLRVEFHDEYDDLINVMQGDSVKMFDGRLLPSRMVITPQDKPGHRTILEYHSMKFDVNITESFFSIQNMRRVE